MRYPDYAQGRIISSLDINPCEDLKDQHTMAGRDREPFVPVNRVLDSPHTHAGSIRRACAVVEDCIANNRDNLRGFFDKCFPNLLKRIFGYDDFEAAWLNIVTKPGRDEDARALVNFLHPKGRLLGAMFSADADALIKFIFPLERLPAHTQELLKTRSGLVELSRWPQYASNIVPDGSGRPQVYLNVFEYFMFWNAFFVLRGGGSSGRAQSGGRGGPGDWGLGSALGMQLGTTLTDIRRMGTTFIHGLQGGGSSGHSVHPYIHLLRLYLEHFLPRTPTPASAASASTAPAPAASTTSSYRAAAYQGMGLFGGGGYGAAAGGPSSSSLYGGYEATFRRATASRGGEAQLGERLLSILLEFWLTDVAEPVPDDLPVPAVTAAGGASPAPGDRPGAADAGGASPGGAALGGMGSPMHSTATAAAAASATALRVLSYQPPGEEHIEALAQLVRYIHIAESSGDGGAGPQGRQAQGRGTQPSVHPAQGREAWLVCTPLRTVTPAVAAGGRGPAGGPSLPPAVLGASGSAGVQATSRKLYRFLRRTIKQWPLQSSASLVPIVNLWLNIITPWAAPSSVTAPPAGYPAASGHGGAAAATGSVGGDGQGRPAWQEGVAHLGMELSHRLAHAVAHDGAQGAGGGSSQQGASNGRKYTPEWRGHVLAHLPFYTILIPRFLELMCARLTFRGDAAAAEALALLRPLADAGPALAAEVGAAEAAYNRYVAAHMRRTSDSSPIGELMPWLAEQVTDWEVAAAAGAPTNPPLLCNSNFCLYTKDPQFSAGAAAAGLLQAAQAQVRADLRDALMEATLSALPHCADLHSGGTPDSSAWPAAPSASVRAYPRAGRWGGVSYKGDWLTRPIASNEVGLLVRVLVAMSQRVNRLLGLDQPWKGEDEEPPEHVLAEVMAWCRKKGYRVSLRPLAEIQTLAWLLVGFYVIRFLYSFFMS